MERNKTRDTNMKKHVKFVAAAVVMDRSGRIVEPSINYRAPDFFSPRNVTPEVAERLNEKLNREMISKKTYLMATGRYSTRRDLRNKKYLLD